jgi:acyl-coenzyme A synthetase/AMP-(fatty) acid ligase
MTGTGNKLADVAADTLALPADTNAVQFHKKWITWGRMKATAEAVEAALTAAGVPINARVAMVIRTRPGFLAALIGLISKKRTIVMVHAYQAPAALATDIQRKTPAAVICVDQDWSPEVKAAVKQMGAAGITLGEGIEGAQRVPGLEKVHGEIVTSPEPQIILLTSGTTGPPKPFPMSYDFIVRAMLSENTQVQPAANAMPGLLFFPMGNISGIYMLMPVIGRKNASIMLERFEVAGWVDYMRTYKPTAASIPPAGVRMLMDADINGEIDKADLASLTHLNSGAAPLNPDTHRAFEKQFGIKILLSYGATEFGGPVTLMTPELRAQTGDTKFDSIGKPIAGAVFQVVDPDTGAVLPPDTEGLLQVKVPRMGPDWIHTTDVVRIDKDGFLFHLGRADGAINRGGFKIMPEPIERALMQHPAVAVASVVAVKDERLGEVPGAMVELLPGATAPSAAELEAHVRKHVPSTFVPVYYDIVPNIPRTSSLKIDMGTIRKQMNEMHRSRETAKA